MRRAPGLSTFFPKPPFQDGDRIKLVEMVDDPAPIEVGALGTVRSCTPIDGRWQVEVHWDNGRRLALIVPPDRAEHARNLDAERWA